MRTIYHFFLCVSFFSIYSKSLNAQNISGKPIPMPAFNEVQMKFHSKIENYSFPQSGADSSFDKPTVKQSKNNSSFTIIAKNENFQPTNLVIVEGKNTHRFVLYYKKDAGDSSLFYDFSDSKTLTKLSKEQYPVVLTTAQAVNNTTSNTQVNPPSVANNNNATTATVIQNSTTSSSPATNANTKADANATDLYRDSLYISLRLAGQRALISNNYDEAETKFKQAAAIKPDDQYIQEKLTDIAKKKSERANIDKKAIDDKYQELLKNAASAYSTGKYDEAEKLYEQAVIANPTDSWPKEQLKRIDAKKDEARLASESKRLDSIYQAYIAAGSKALADKSFDDARSAYQQALTIKPKDPVAQLKLKEIDKKMADQKLDEENKKKDSYFNSYMTLGNEALQKNSLDEAENAYTEALKIKPTNADATKQLAKIKDARNKIVEKENEQKLAKERDEKYAELIKLGDKAVLSEMYETAAEYYKKASQLKPEAPYPASKLKEVNEILSTLTAEKDKKAKDSALTAQYKMAIDKGDKALAALDFKNAKIAFQLASGLKPDEQYPKNELQEIEIKQQEITNQKKEEAERIQKQAQTDKQYKMIISQANSAYAKKDYEIAKKAYTEAGNLKPDEDLPKQKLLDVTAKIDSIQQVKETEDKYEVAITAADSLAFVAKDYVAALKFYREAKDLKPAEAYPAKQLNYLQGELNRKEQEVIQTKKDEERKVRFNKGMVAYDSAIAATGMRRYEDALSYYKQFVTLVDSSDLNQNQYGYRALIKSAVDKIKDIEDYLARTKPKQAAQAPEPPKEETDKKGRKKKS